MQPLRPSSLHCLVQQLRFSDKEAPPAQVEYYVSRACGAIVHIKPSVIF